MFRAPWLPHAHIFAPIVAAILGPVEHPSQREHRIGVQTCAHRAMNRSRHRAHDGIVDSLGGHQIHRIQQQKRGFARSPSPHGSLLDGLAPVASSNCVTALRSGAPAACSSAISRLCARKACSRSSGVSRWAVVSSASFAPIASFESIQSVYPYHLKSDTRLVLLGTQTSPQANSEKGSALFSPAPRCASSERRFPTPRTAAGPEPSI